MRKLTEMTDKMKEKYADLFVSALDSMEGCAWQKPWLTPNNGVPCNIDRKRKPYKRVNAFLLQLLCTIEGYETPFFLTMKQMKERNIHTNIKLDANAPKKADISKSQEVGKICTEYAQKGMLNIFIAIFCFALGFACLSSPGSIGGNDAACLFVSYLISIAVFGLFQAVFMANAGGAWDNAKKVVEVDLKAKGTPLHDASVVGDTVGDPFKDTSSVALNPIIKFTTLFGVLAMEIAISDSFKELAPYFGIGFVLIAICFVYRSFYKMKSF